MSSKPRNRSKKPAQAILRDKLHVGDIVRLEWLDVHGYERQTVDDIKQLTDPQPTRSYGVVVRLLDKCLVLAHEIGDCDGDGYQTSQYPFGLILACDVLGQEKNVFGDDSCPTD